MTEAGTDIALIAETAVVAAFTTTDQMDEILDRVEKEARSQAADVTTKKGRDAIASLAHKVARSKTALDAAGKKLNESARAQINVVDAERRRAWDRLEKLQAEVRAPLTEWEDKEKARVDALKARLERLQRAHEGLGPFETASADIAALVARVEATAIDDTWAEFVADAARAKDQQIATLRTMLAEAQKHEADIAELRRLRDEAAERERLEVAAKAQAEAAEAERRKQDEIRLAAEQAAAQAKADAEKAEATRTAKEAVERESERKAAADREAALQKQIADQKAETERAAQVERDRIAAQTKAEADAKAKREADQSHRATIRKAIIDALATMRGNATPEAIADALMEGKIPHTVVVL